MVVAIPPRRLSHQYAVQRMQMTLLVGNFVTSDLGGRGGGGRGGERVYTSALLFDLFHSEMGHLPSLVGSVSYTLRVAPLN